MRHLPRLLLVASLSLTSAFMTGCEDENDPKTWVSKLSEDTKRPVAMHHLRDIWQSRVGTTNNLSDPSVRQFMDTSLNQITSAFTEHRDEISTRKDAIEILATCNDTRALPALLNALEYSPGNSDSERIALRAAQAIRTMRPRENPQVIQKLVSAIDRAVGNSGSAPQIREAVILALGDLGDTSVVPRLREVLKRPIDQQEIRTARAAADAIGLLGDPTGADALVYGLYLNVNRANAFNNCSRGLMRLGAAAAVPLLIRTLNNDNLEVAALIQSYGSVPNAPPPPPGLQQSTAIDVLRNFADRSAIDPLVTVLRNHEASQNVRGAAAESLAFTALTLPTADPQRTHVFDEIAGVFREGTVGGADDMAPVVAPALSLIGDPRAPGIISQRLRARELQGADTVLFRLGLLMPFASAARHGDVAEFDRLAMLAQTQLEGLLRDNPDGASDIQPVQRQLETIRRVVSVARDCNDGDLACYQQRLTNPDKDVIRKAAYMIAWTGGENPAARQSLLGVANNPDPLVRRSLNVAIDSLSPHGCPECVTRLEQIIEGEHGQESKSLMHLEAQMLIARIRNRH